MVEISRYRSRFSGEGREFVPPNERFVAYVDSEPTLMLELTATGFQFYGPRALSVDEFLTNIQFATQVSSFDLRERLLIQQPRARVYLFAGATLTCSESGGQTSVWSLDNPRLEEVLPGRPFRDFYSFAALMRSLVPDEPTYLKVTIPMIGVTHWADIEGTQNPRSGFLLDQVLFFEPRWFKVNSELIFTLFRSLTVAKLDQKDISEIIDFMFGDQREHNV
jgi:hypothetical protein